MAESPAPPLLPKELLTVSRLTSPYPRFSYLDVELSQVADINPRVPGPPNTHQKGDQKAH